MATSYTHRLFLVARNDIAAAFRAEVVAQYGVSPASYFTVSRMSDDAGATATHFACNGVYTTAEANAIETILNTVTAQRDRVVVSGQGKAAIDAANSVLAAYVVLEIERGRPGELIHHTAAQVKGLLGLVDFDA